MSRYTYGGSAPKLGRLEPWRRAGYSSNSGAVALAVIS